MAGSKRRGHTQNILVEGKLLQPLFGTINPNKKYECLCANNPTFRNLLPCSKMSMHQRICGNHVYHNVVCHVNMGSGLNVH